MKLYPSMKVDAFPLILHSDPHSAAPQNASVITHMELYVVRKVYGRYATNNLNSLLRVCCLF